MEKDCYDVAVERPGLPGFPEDKTVYIPVVVHEKPDSHCIIINYPGLGSNVDGYMNRWEKLAVFMQGKIGATIIRMPNIDHGDTYEHYCASVKADLCAVIEYTIANAVTLCGVAEPDIFLMGYSAGASAVAAVACDYAVVKKILLIAPSYHAGKKEVGTGISLFKGYVYILEAEYDYVVGPVPRQLHELAGNTAPESSTLRRVPDCGHQFKGTENGRVLSGAPLWAFKYNGRFPKPKECIDLY
ncbi:MAG: hypothetical protein HGA67_00160 [Candidatus Yonathbacteria bacterium]|nr:hypothetical protein [Candidatus Yonathbacteria bacterium]